MLVFCDPRFRFGRGDHVCIFYQSEDTLAEYLVPFTLEGLQHGEKCICFQTPGILKRLGVELPRAGVDLDREIGRGALEFVSLQEGYLVDGAFQPSVMVEALTKRNKEWQAQGFRGLRLSGDLSLFGDGRVSAKVLVQYEQMVATFVADSRVTGLCQYPAKSFRKKTVSALVEEHNCNVVDPSTPSEYSWIQLRHKEFVAEIITDRNAKAEIYSFIVRRPDSQDIVQSGSARNFSQARLKAERALRSLSKPH
jgi:hypothetical protein